MVEPKSADPSRTEAVLLTPRPYLERPTAPLPTALTSFVGRGQEIQQVTAFLRRDDVRLLSLIGPGGVGKTRLTLRVAEDLAADFTDGVALVSLDPIRDPALVTPTISTGTVRRQEVRTKRSTCGVGHDWVTAALYQEGLAKQAGLRAWDRRPGAGGLMCLRMLLTSARPGQSERSGDPDRAPAGGTSHD